MPDRISGPAPTWRRRRVCRARGALVGGLVLGAVVGVASCTTGTPAAPAPPASSPSTPTPTPTPTPTSVSAEVRAPEAPSTVLADSDAETSALAVSGAVFVSAPAVVLAPVGDAVVQDAAASQAVRLGVPVLLTGGTVTAEAIAAEVERLGAQVVIALGSAVAPTGVRSVAVEEVLPRRVAWGDSLPHIVAPRPPVGALVLTDGGPTHLVALASARAAGVPVLVVPSGDPRQTAESVVALAEAAPRSVLALGSVFVSPEVLAPRIAAAATGVQVPGGGQLVFPVAAGQVGKRYVALYGTPGTAGLGALGEQDVPATIARAQATAEQYRTLTGDTVVPMLEIIATIASAGPGDDGNYSQERPVAELRPLVDAAGAAGMAVVLDLQPGRTDFVTQAQQYAELLALPHVGLALDPEWRLAPDQVHLRQIGSVGVDEVNAVSSWLAGFSRERALPQKLFVLHQFAPRMIAGRERLDTGHDELAVLVHVDGQGSQPAKAGTWGLLQQDAPAGVRWGWKNFYDEDAPMLDPGQTMQVLPVPDLVTYQ